MDKKVYIRSIASISPQKTFGDMMSTDELLEYAGDKFTCVEPDYSKIFDPKLIRRMSRIIKMGAATAIECLHKSGVKMPDAILTGTAYGCLEDTSVFLTKLIENREDMLTPTAFIQSTHNTVGAQIALILKCHNYNNTFVHRGFSFESALLDAMLLLNENENTNVLAGAVDEITNNSHRILSRFGLYKHHASNRDLLLSNSKGTMAGEGASFFSLTNQSSPENIAQLVAMATFYKPLDIEETEKNIVYFLEDMSTDMNDIDLVILGKNGDQKGDKVYDHLSHSIFKNRETIGYKHLCGEYPTATAFAVWLASTILQNKMVPGFVGVEKNGSPIKKILIYNHYERIHHSLFLLSA
ncbi:MAG: beta-ketoacyl synthase chain length factor [Bacteroidetes bacterium]|nr:beta-ketoacyl synthase chain length factor [Bacteroidota bacterium]